jgi:hypothetical protein
MRRYRDTYTTANDSCYRRVMRGETFGGAQISWIQILSKDVSSLRHTSLVQRHALEIHVKEN